MSTTVDSDRARRARDEPLEAERIAPGMFIVTNLRRGSEHVVDLREQACDCRDFQYRGGPQGERCYHLEFVMQVAGGELCPICGYSMCRPSCPNRSDRR